MITLFKNTWRKTDQYKQVTRLYQLIIILLLVFIALQHQHVTRALVSQRIYVTPSLAATGGYTKTNMISDALLFDVVFTTFTTLNTWRGGEDSEEYQRQIEAHRYLLTPAYYAQLKQDFLTKKSLGELSRLRVLSGYHGQDVEAMSIKQLNANTWEVDMTLRLEERVGNTAVKDVLIRYPIKVVRSDLSPTLNPYGLALDGFVREPERVQTLI